MIGHLRLADLTIRAYAEPEEFGLFAVRRERTPGGVVVAYNGTRNVVDWMSSVRLGLVDSTVVGGRMHGGYERLWTRIRASVVAMLARERAASGGGPADWSVVGHSLGGVIATLTALAIRRMWPDDRVTLVTFGTPRFTDLAGSGHLAGLLPGARHYRLDFDPVPWFPRRWPWRRYADLAGGVRLARSRGPWEPSGPSLWKRLPFLRRHDLIHYRAALADEVNW